MRIAIIPARGGSKRIPRKNIKAFCGQPIIAYSIQAALRSDVFDKVIVTTDDSEIGDVARLYGAEMPFIRPSNLADDHATTVPVIKHAIDWVNANIGGVEFACCIYATAPFVQSRDLAASYEKLVGERVGGYVFSACTFPFPIQRAFKVKADGHVEMFEPQNYNTRSQDLAPAYQDAGQFYWGSASSYMQEKIFFSPDSKAFVLPRHMVQDIDSAEDWTRAELMYAALKANGDID
jgi:pseudaminic acid cytidylyltransferase